MQKYGSVPLSTINYLNYQCHQVSGLMFCNQNQPELGPKVFGNYGVYPLGALIHEIDIGVGHRLLQPGESGARKFGKKIGSLGKRPHFGPKLWGIG